MNIQLFPKVTIPYYVAAPSWTHRSSGVRVLHLLVHALNSIGQKAYLIPLQDGEYVRHPHLDTPLLVTDHESFYNQAEIQPIAIYPDIVIGNPYNCKKVVRYLLAPPKHEIESSFLPSDKIYYYRSDMGLPVLCLPTFDSSIFHPPPAVIPNGDGVTARLHSRSGTCFYSCKYEAFGNNLLPVTNDSTRLHGIPQKIADILRQSEKMYLYEHSEIEVLANMCACPVEHVKTDFWQGAGENWHFANGDLNSWMLDFGVHLEKFVVDTQDWK